MVCRRGGLLLRTKWRQSSQDFSQARGLGDAELRLPGAERRLELRPLGRSDGAEHALRVQGRVARTAAPQELREEWVQSCVILRIGGRDP